MQAAARRFCMLAALLLALATFLGALSVHAFRPHLSAERYDVLQTGVQYQFFQALGLMGIGLLCDRVPSRLLSAAAWLVFLGVLGFCGSLYLLVAGAPNVVGIATPLGGLALIAGWCLCALALWSAGRGRGPRHG
jgi:uncharacterized membrane protein YgdD (TMEM256/DUF423 family)